MDPGIPSYFSPVGCKDESGYGKDNEKFKPFDPVLRFCDAATRASKKPSGQHGFENTGQSRTQKV
jgi:hypothetical protein